MNLLQVMLSWKQLTSMRDSKSLSKAIKASLDTRQRAKHLNPSLALYTLFNMKAMRKSANLSSFLPGRGKQRLKSLKSLKWLKLSICLKSDYPLTNSLLKIPSGVISYLKRIYRHRHTKNALHIPNSYQSLQY